MTFLLKLLSTQMEFCINLLLKWKHKNIYRLTLISIISFSDNFSWESFYNLKRRFPLSITPLSEHPTLKIQVKDLKHDAHQSSWGDWDAGRTEFGIYISLMKIIHYTFYSALQCFAWAWATDCFGNHLKKRLTPAHFNWLPLKPLFWVPIS